MREVVNLLTGKDLFSFLVVNNVVALTFWRNKIFFLFSLFFYYNMLVFFPAHTFFSLLFVLPSFWLIKQLSPPLSLTSSFWWRWVILTAVDHVAGKTSPDQGHLINGGMAVWSCSKSIAVSGARQNKLSFIWRVFLERKIDLNMQSVQCKDLFCYHIFTSFRYWLKSNIFLVSKIYERIKTQIKMSSVFTIINAK